MYVHIPSLGSWKDKVPICNDGCQQRPETPDHKSKGEPWVRCNQLSTRCPGAC